jgi:hypothetical protein
MAEKMESLWIWVSEYPDGSIVTVGGKIGRENFALQSPKREIAEKMRPLAQHHAATTGQRVWLREFTTFKDHGSA